MLGRFCTGWRGRGSELHIGCLVQTKGDVKDSVVLKCIGQGIILDNVVSYVFNITRIIISLTISVYLPKILFFSALVRIEARRYILEPGQKHNQLWNVIILLDNELIILAIIIKFS